jgi:hypothetical protein
MTRNAFCQSRSLSLPSFDFWRREIAKRDAENQAISATRTESQPANSHSNSTSSKPSTRNHSKPILLPVQIISTPTLEVRLTNGRIISVPPGFDPTHLQMLLTVLETQSC